MVNRALFARVLAGALPIVTVSEFGQVGKGMRAVHRRISPQFGATQGLPVHGEGSPYE